MKEPKHPDDAFIAAMSALYRYRSAIEDALDWFVDDPRWWMVSGCGEAIEALEATARAWLPADDIRRLSSAAFEESRRRPGRRSATDQTPAAPKEPSGFAAWVRALRDASGLTQRAFARRVGSHAITVARWEAGANVPRSALVRREIDDLAAAVGHEPYDWDDPADAEESR